MALPCAVMRIHRGYLFWGIVFLLLGAIPLAERSGLIDGDRLGEIGRLWPLALIAVGIAIVLARSGIALVGTIVAAVIIGGLAGGVLAAGNGWFLGVGSCAGVGDTSDMARTDRSGTFTGPALVQAHIECGSLEIQAGVASDSLAGWVLTARHHGAPPDVDSDDTSLSLDVPEGGIRRHDWTLFLPRALVARLELTGNAATIAADVSGARLEAVRIEANAGDVRLLATDATIDDLGLRLNAGRARLLLGGDTDGAIEVNAGTIDLCVPADAALRITLDDDFAFATNLADRGLTRLGDTWARPGAAVGAPVIDLRVQGNAGSFTLDPAGGCA